MNKFNWKANISTVSDKFKLYSAKKLIHAIIVGIDRKLLSTTFFEKCLSFIQIHLIWIIYFPLNVVIWGSECDPQTFPFQAELVSSINTFSIVRLMHQYTFLYPPKKEIWFSIVSIEISFFYMLMYIFFFQIWLIICFIK